MWIPHWDNPTYIAAPGMLCSLEHQSSPSVMLMLPQKQSVITSCAASNAKILRKLGYIYAHEATRPAGVKTAAVFFHIKSAEILR